MHVTRDAPSLHGVLAEYGSAQELIDAYTPYPIEALNEIVCDHHQSKVPMICLIGGIVGALGGWALAYWTSTIDYPLNIGGKPLNSWPAFIPVIFETTILLAAFSAGLGMLALNRLPEPYHPVFNVESFRDKSSRDGYFLCIEADDARFDRESARDLLAGTGALGVHDVDA
jgi:hypothetical protein